MGLAIRGLMLVRRLRTRKSTTVLATVGIVALLATGTLFLLSACEGPGGPAGQIGAPGAAGAAGTAGATGPQGAAGTANSDGGLTTSCMLPCHGFNGIVEQWKTSTHYFGAIENLEEEAAWTNPKAACGNCHATDGLPTRIAGQYVISGADAGPVNAALGQLNYKKGSTAAEIGYGGSAPLAIIGCTTCHDAFVNDPHLTGGNYTKGEFKLRVPTGPNDQAYIEKSPTAGTFTGTAAGKWGSSNACIYCHKSRKDVTNYITGGVTLTSAYWGPHDGPHSDVFTGLGGYHFGANTYGNSTHQQSGGCGTCHMPKVAQNGNYPDHSFRPQISTCTSAGCHVGAKSFDVAGGQGVIKAALASLQAALNTNLGALTRSSAAPYAALTTELGDGQYNLDRSRPGAALTKDQAGALYNYLLLARASAWGVHNPIYTKQLIYDSYLAVRTGGDPATPAGIPTRP